MKGEEYRVQYNETPEDDLRLATGKTHRYCGWRLQATDYNHVWVCPIIKPATAIPMDFFVPISELPELIEALQSILYEATKAAR